MIFAMVVISDAPSILEDSISSRGMVLKKFVRIRMVPCLINLNFLYKHFISRCGDLHLQRGYGLITVVNQRILQGKGILKLADLLMSDAGSLVQRILAAAAGFCYDAEALHPLPLGNVL